MGTVSKFILPASFASTFFGNVADNVAGQADTGNKIKTLVNATTGKILGLNIFSGVPQFGVKIGLSNIANPVTTGGATMFAVGLIGGALGLPRAGMLKSIGGKIAVGSFIGSMFEGDAGTPTTPTTTVTTSPTGQFISI